MIPQRQKQRSPAPDLQVVGFPLADFLEKELGILLQFLTKVKFFWAAKRASKQNKKPSRYGEWFWQFSKALYVKSALASA